MSRLPGPAAGGLASVSQCLGTWRKQGKKGRQATTGPGPMARLPFVNFDVNFESNGNDSVLAGISCIRIMSSSARIFPVKIFLHAGLGHSSFLR